MEVHFLPSLVRDLLEALSRVPADPAPLALTSMIAFERCLELITDLLSQIPTRRFLHLVLEDTLFLTRVRKSRMFERADGAPFRQLFEMLEHYFYFGLDNHTGQPLTDDEVQARRYRSLQLLQRLVYQHMSNVSDAEAVRDCKEFALSAVGPLTTLTSLRQRVETLPTAVLTNVVKHLRLVPAGSEVLASREELVDLLVHAHTPRKPLLETINRMALYPDDSTLWNPSLIPTAYSASRPLALPKLNLQFLTVHDFMLRSFHLYRLESAYEIREDIIDAVKRLNP
jgi:intron-binding protein aquarius